MNARFPRFPVTFLALAAALLPVAACSPPPDTASPDLTAAFREIAAQPADLGLAVAHATQRCLRAKGFDAPLPAAFSGSVANLPVRVDEQTARTVGYGSTLLRGIDEVQSPLDRYAAALPSARRTEFDQVLDDDRAPRARMTTPRGWVVSASRGGCAAEGRAAVFGSVDNWLAAFYLPQDLNLVASDVQSDPRVREAAGTFQTCMAAKGYAIASPHDAMAAAQGWSKGKAVRGAPRAEIQLATADAECQRRSGVVDVCLTALTHAAMDWIKANEQVVVETAEAIRASRLRASRLLAGVGPG
jgi:hypothetical protein